MKEKQIELLSPAGDMERLKLAVKFGADAVYVGANMFTMRAGAKNFTFESLKQAASFAHENGVKLYLTCNTLPRNDEIGMMPQFLKDAASCDIDAFIIADMGVLSLAKKYAPEIDVHISTQAGIVNYEAANAFYEMGASRIVTARELSLDDIKTIRDKTNPNLEIEAFVHGAMCMSFSGRCLLSDYMVGRDANRGDCAQPCRWKYHLMEETRPGEFFPVYQDDNGSHILNSKDLCMIEHISELDKAGIDSFKIEGRAKSEYYTAIVTYAYRNAIDGYLASGRADNYKPQKWILDEMNKMSHRVYTTGFYFGHIKSGQVYQTAGYIRDWDVVALFEKVENDRLFLKQRNRFYPGDVLEVVEPGKKPYKFTVEDLRDVDGEIIDVANKAAATVSVKCDREISPDAIFRRERTDNA